MHPLVKYGAPLLNLVPPSFIKIFCDLITKFDPYGINDSLIRKILGQLYHFYQNQLTMLKFVQSPILENFFLYRIIILQQENWNIPPDIFAEFHQSIYIPRFFCLRTWASFKCFCIYED